MIRIVSTAVLAALTFSAPALAQDQMMMEDNRAMMMGENGQMMMMPNAMNESMMSMAQQNAQEVPEGAIFFMSGGKLYMTQDMKMENGMMMSDEMMKQ